MRAQSQCTWTLLALFLGLALIEPSPVFADHCSGTTISCEACHLDVQVCRSFDCDGRMASFWSSRCGSGSGTTGGGSHGDSPSTTIFCEACHLGFQDCRSFDGYGHAVTDWRSRCNDDGSVPGNDDHPTPQPTPTPDVNTGVGESGACITTTTSCETACSPSAIDGSLVKICRSFACNGVRTAKWEVPCAASATEKAASIPPSPTK